MGRDRRRRVGLSAPVKVYRNNTPFETSEYLTDFWGTEAVRFVERNRQRPFFLYLGFNAPHAPLHALDADKTVGESASPDRHIYAGMVKAMDRNVGRVMTALRSNRLERDTLVIFINDNGGGGNHTHHTRAIPPAMLRSAGTSSICGKAVFASR